MAGAFAPLVSRTLPVAVLIATMTIAGCSSMGNGSGSDLSDGKSVAFAWNSVDGGKTGNLSVTMEVNDKFKGAFVQTIKTIQTNDLAPLWYGKHTGWPEWNHGDYGSQWSESPEAEFATHYSDVVVSNLEGQSSKKLFCRFHLNRPSSGMRGGGQGECKLTGGHTLVATFPRT